MPRRIHMSKKCLNRISRENSALSRSTIISLVSPAKATLVSYNMILGILSQEVEHEEDLDALREDLELMLARRQ